MPDELIVWHGSRDQDDDVANLAVDLAVVLRASVVLYPKKKLLKLFAGYPRPGAGRYFALTSINGKPLLLSTVR